MINEKILNKGKILWTNPNPSNKFPSSGDYGTINLSSDDYDFIIWVCSDNNVFSSPGGCFIYYKGQKYINFSNAIGSAGSQLINIFRYLRREDDKTFIISRCFKYVQSSSNTSMVFDDLIFLPLCAVGFKL